MKKTLLTLSLLLGTPSWAVASEPNGEEELPNIVAVRVSGGVAMEGGEIDGVMGVGAGLERAFLHHRLELEVIGSYVRHGEHHGMSGELVVKLPWSPSAALDVYAGGGGVVSYGDHHMSGGAVLDVGMRAWQSRRWGVGMELDMIQWFNHGKTREVEGIFDVMYRF